MNYFVSCHVRLCVCILLTDVLKQYLRNLPEPLMTFDLCDDWLAVSVLYVMLYILTCLPTYQLI